MRGNFATAKPSLRSLSSKKKYNFEMEKGKLHTHFLGYYHLNLPPLLPGSTQKLTDENWVSNVFFLLGGVAIFLRKNSAAVMLRSKLILCPAIHCVRYGFIKFFKHPRQINAFCQIALRGNAVYFFGIVWSGVTLRLDY